MRTIVQKGRALLVTIFALRWKPEGDTWMALACGCGVVLTSWLLGVTVHGNLRAWGGFLLDNVLMRVVLGLAVPLYYTLIVRREPLAALGLTRRRLALSVILSLVLLPGLLSGISQDVTTTEEVTTGQAMGYILDAFRTMPGAIYFLLVAGFFELFFFHGYLQLRFERAYGLIPGILLCTVFYSLHHVGFEGDWANVNTLTELFWVGITVSIIFRLTRNIFIAWPILYLPPTIVDVLYAHGATNLPFVNALTMTALMVLAGLYVYAARGEAGKEKAMLVDKFLPQADIVNQRSILIEGTPAEVYLALKGWAAAVSPWGRWLLRLRDLPNRLLRGKSVAVLEQKGVDLRPGEKANFFLVLAAEENREVVLGIVGKFWRPWGNLYPVVRVEDFVSFRQRRYAKAVTSFLLEPVGERVTGLMNVTRVKGYGKSSRFLFSLYWLLISPFHNLILKAILRRIKRTVEMTQSQ